MCGISGLVNCGDRETLTRMTSVQAHRGPDDVGLWERQFPDGGYIGLGSRRLSIIDLSPSGHMPMCNADRTLWITYNGEIYNFAALRRELQSKGHRFDSSTDTEVVLHLYEQEGPECVKRLNGMFAFAICDLRSPRPQLFVARDHFGVKPFYYTHFGLRFAFASEIKALLEVPGIVAEIDPQSLHQYLSFLWVPEPNTMFRGIHKLPAGHSATFRDGQFRITKYWDLTFPPADATYSYSEPELAEAIGERFRTSVEAQMVADVPVGAFLSAGLDSSSIVAMLARATRQPLRTYTVTYPVSHRVGENALDDPDIPARLARRLNIENQQIMVEPDVVRLLPQLIWHMDEPVADPAIIAAYLVCREASKQSTVLLSGVGGDELFAGYRKHYAHYWAQAYQKIPPQWRRWIDASLTRLPNLRGTRAKGHVRLAKKMAHSASLPPAQRFVANCTYLNAQQKASLYAPALWDQVREFDPAVQHWDSFDRVRDADFLNQMLYLDSKIFMPSLNLNYNDKMSMASSVEVRVPFLDPELVEFVTQNVPPGLKLKGFLRPTTKHIFREAMRDFLPEDVLNQPKAGFAAPVDYWLAHELREMVDDLLAESRVRQRGLFRHEAMRAYLNEHRGGAHDWSMQIWQFLTLELWMQTFLDGRAKHHFASCTHPQVAIA
jgi:asparagine synthase (glutamine-hydrolysing)